MLKYTGHPFVDVGAATIAAFAGKRDPTLVTLEDLEKLGGYLEEQYARKFLGGYLVCVFPNSAYVNPTSGPEKKRAFLNDHLFSFRSDITESNERCGICGGPAVTRGYRQHVPMLTGEGVLNFFPNGSAGLALCAGCMTSIAALPLGSLRCSGRALAVHSDNDDLTAYFAREHFKRNRAQLQLQDLADDAKFADTKQMRTRLVDELRKWCRERSRATRTAPVSLTAYHFTNSGQGPTIDIHYLPSPVLDFLRDAESGRYHTIWHAIIRAAWRAKEKDPNADTHRNYLYEALFRLPDQWPRFVRTYFLRRAYRARPKDTPPAADEAEQDLSLVSWQLTELFLKGVVSMQDHRVKAIRDFGDRVADYIAERDAGFWQDIHHSKYYGTFRVKLLNASRSEEKAGRSPLIGFDDFITIFEYEDETSRPDWRLARDLLLIRVIERLHEKDWFAKNPEALTVEIPEDDSINTAAVTA